VTWFDRQAGADPQDAAVRLDAAVAKSKLMAVLEQACGRFGRRRFVVRFEAPRGAARVVGLESELLPGGGGPPPPAAFDVSVPKIEAALRTLRTALPPGFHFSRGAIGVLRAMDGPIVVSFRFDEDAGGYALRDLMVPRGATSPVEHPDYLRELAKWETRIGVLRDHWAVAQAEWSYTPGALVHDGDRREALAIGRWTPKTGRYAWLLEKPAGEEMPFVEREVAVEMGGALELSTFAAARLGWGGLFQGETADGDVVFFATRG
jgi:hypothetical protein